MISERSHDTGFAIVSGTCAAYKLGLHTWRGLPLFCIPSDEGVEKHRSALGTNAPALKVCMLYDHAVHAVQALAMQDAYEAEDEVDDAADNAAEAQKKRTRAAPLASGARLPDTSAYFHERLFWGAYCIA